MRVAFFVLLSATLACASSPREAERPSLASSGVADQGTFFVTLGRDTIAAERFRMGSSRLDGELVIRLRETVRRPYAMTFDATGNVSRLEFSTRRPTDTPSSAPMQAVTVTFAGDTIVMETRRNDSTITRRIAAPRGTVPLLGQSYASYEVLTRRAARSMSDSVVIPAWAVGAQRIDQFSVVRVNPDTVKIVAPFGTTFAHVDAAGRLQGAHALTSTLKVIVQRQPMTDLTAVAMMPAIPQLSPRDTLRAAIAGANFTVTYSRPSKRGRAIFGATVPWGDVWRTGANEATHFHTDKDLVVGGVPIPAGTYTMWTIPRPEGWTLILNKQTGQWGTVYDEAQDLARIPMRDEAPSSPVEQFTISVEPHESGAALRLRWDDREAWVPIEVKAED
jgi:hypothetical protein